MINYYDATEIHEAKDCLWEVYDEAVFGTKPRRQGSKQKSVIEFEVEDVMKGLQALGTTQAWGSKARSFLCIWCTAGTQV